MHTTTATYDTHVSGSIWRIKSPMPIPLTEYNNRFCGFPTGVSILPRLAAIVSNTTTGISTFSQPAIAYTDNVNGIKVIKETSFVISILAKKHRLTSTKVNPLVVCTRLHSFSPSN